MPHNTVHYNANGVFIFSTVGIGRTISRSINCIEVLVELLINTFASKQRKLITVSADILAIIMYLRLGNHL
jgi:hypothetical protein